MCRRENMLQLVQRSGRESKQDAVEEEGDEGMNDFSCNIWNRWLIGDQQGVKKRQIWRWIWFLMVRRRGWSPEWHVGCWPRENDETSKRRSGTFQSRNSLVFLLFSLRSLRETEGWQSLPRLCFEFKYWGIPLWGLQSYNIQHASPNNLCYPAKQLRKLIRPQLDSWMSWALKSGQTCRWKTRSGTSLMSHT